MVDVPIVGDVAHVLEDMLRVYKSRAVTPEQKSAGKHWWEEIEGWRGRDCLAYRKDDKAIKPQYAVQRLYELTKGPEYFHHHGSRSASNVGGTILSF